jgi:DNA-binding NarL/FixJ family response regulator
VQVSVLIVDPQPFFCESLASALAGADPQLVVSGWATDELEAETIASDRHPDIVLTELELNSGSGLGLARRLRDRVRSVLLTRHHAGEVLADAVAAGMFGCLSHDSDVASLRTQVIQAASGRFAVDGDRLYETLRRAIAARSDGGATARVARLTVREREVLRLLAIGLDNDAIAAQLHLSRMTVRTHVGSILRKLEVHSRADAARVAMAAGEGVGGRVLRILGPELAGP